MDTETIIQSTIQIGFITGALMYVVPFFTGYCIHSILSVFKQIIKK